MAESAVEVAAPALLFLDLAAAKAPHEAASWSCTAVLGLWSGAQALLYRALLSSTYAA